MINKLLFCLSLTLLASLPITSVAQQSEQELSTDIEVFIAKTGAVIIRGFSEIGSISGQFNTSVKVEAREFINAGSGEKQYGIAIEVIGNREQSNSSYVDYDEIESIMQGLEYISKIDQSVTTLNNFQADYRTKGHLILSTYTSRGRVQFSVQSGRVGRQTAFLNLSDAEQLKSLINQAKQKIDSMR